MTAKQLLKEESRSMNRPCRMLGSAVLGDAVIILYEPEGDIGRLRQHRIAGWSPNGMHFSHISNSWFDR